MPIPRASFGYRLGAALFDLIVLCVVIHGVSYFVPFPRIAMMQSYSPFEFSDYFQTVGAVCGVMFAYSLILQSLRPMNATLGKFVFGIRLATADEQPPAFRQVLLRCLIIQGYVALIVLPGPLIAYVFANSTSGLSMTALLMALIVVPLLLFLPRGNDEAGDDKAPWHQRLSGAYTVMRRERTKTGAQ